VAHSPACPSRSRYSLAAGKRINDDIEWLSVEIEQVVQHQSFRTKSGLN
jgi:hypothetical protein